MVTLDSQLSISLLKTLLECPVCLETLTLPVTQCTRGHVVCGKCRRRLQTCHTCREPLRRSPREIRNLALENILVGQLFRCEHSGCKENLSVNALDRHERICPHNPNPSPNIEPEPEPEKIVFRHTRKSRRPVQTPAPAPVPAPVPPPAPAPAPSTGQPGTVVAVSWVQARDGDVPEGSLCGGCNGDGELIVARAECGGALTPGKFIANHGVCYVPWGGREHRIHHYETLVVPVEAVSWTTWRGVEVPKNAILGGWSEDGEPLYIGRAIHEGILTLGKFQPSHRSLYISYGGVEIARRSNFKILVLN